MIGNRKYLYNSYLFVFINILVAQDDFSKTWFQHIHLISKKISGNSLPKQNGKSTYCRLKKKKQLKPYRNMLIKMQEIYILMHSALSWYQSRGRSIKLKRSHHLVTKESYQSNTK